MQRRHFIELTAAFAATSAFPVFAADFQEGKDFVMLEKPLEGCEGLFVKVFSYDCPFCYKYDAQVDPKVLPRIEKEVGLKFSPRHLETKGQYGRPASLFFAMCMLRDQKAGVSLEDSNSLFKKAKDAYYIAYHRKQERWTSGEAAFIKTGCDATGITPADFAAASKDPAVIALADSWKPTYEVAKIQGIPAYVVNGKYLIMTKAIQSFDWIVNITKYLAAKK